MTPFASSPQGEAVCERKVKTSDEAKELFIKDVQTLLKQGVSPGQIVVLLNEPKRESCLADLRNFGTVKFESLGRYFDANSSSVRFTTINVFKGLEADVVFLFVRENYTKENMSEVFYVEASRAKLLLYIYFQQFDDV